jgi:surface antigen
MILEANRKMTDKFPVFLAITALLFTFSSCVSRGPHEEVGMVIGGVLGGVLGQQVGGGSGRTAATIIGTIAGVSIGGAMGRSMDDVDRMKVAASLETTRTGVASRWQNPDTGNVFTVVPTRTIESATGPCREYTLDAQIGGRPEQIFGTACRQADGSWRTVE